jgi:phage FluMu protein Com
MALEIRCTGCGKTLRVGEEHAGRQIRCPACQQISVAPAASMATATSLAQPGQAANPDAQEWHMRTPEGQTYGPVSWPQLQAWAGEGRLAADCYVGQSNAGPWRGAAELFPSLTPQRAGPVITKPPAIHDWLPPNSSGDDTAPFASPGFAPTASRGGGGEYVVPHRAGLILVLGLLGFVVNCPVFCFMAWVMGSSDLREMRAGRMDKSGEGLTQVGQVLGMILSLLWILGGVVVLLFILIAAVNGV